MAFWIVLGLAIIALVVFVPNLWKVFGVLGVAFVSILSVLAKIAFCALVVWACLMSLKHAGEWPYEDQPAKAVCPPNSVCAR